MALIFTKLISDVKAELRFFKFAYQFWLKENSPEACANVTLCLVNLSKDASAKGFSVYFPFEVYDISPNSKTLLDKSCPLNSARGGYEYPRYKKDIMPKLDGVPDVRVDLLHDVNPVVHILGKLRISQVDVLLKKDIKPGEKIGLRITFKTKGVITNIDESTISFLCKIFDMHKYGDFVAANDLESREIKVQCYYDWDTKSGGFDPIIYYPQEYEIREFIAPYASVIDREDINYNYLGKDVENRYKKVTWRAWQLRNCTKDNFIVGYKNYIQWFCAFQDAKALDKMVKRLQKEIKLLNTKLVEQTNRSKLFGILTIILGLISIVLGIILFFL